MEVENGRFVKKEAICIKFIKEAICGSGKWKTYKGGHM